MTKEHTHTLWYWALYLINVAHLKSIFLLKYIYIYIYKACTRHFKFVIMTQKRIKNVRTIFTEIKSNLKVEDLFFVSIKIPIWYEQWDLNPKFKICNSHQNLHKIVIAIFFNFILIFLCLVQQGKSTCPTTIYLNRETFIWKWKTTFLCENFNLVLQIL